MGTVRSTYSAAVALPETAIPDHPREILRQGVTGAEFEFCGRTVRAGDLPLVDRDGRQCVRLVVRGDGPPARVSVIVDGQTVATGALETSRVFVPEVRSAVDATLVLEAASGETLHRPLRIEPQRKWSVFIIHHSHLDIGYTDLQGTVLRHHLSYLDEALELAARTDGWPDDAAFRWNVESLLPLERWLAARPAAACEELAERVRSRRFEVCALPFGTHLEALSVDELAAMLRRADHLREQRGFPIVTAMQTDVPGAPAGLPALLASAGIRYLAVAHNYAGRAAPYLTGGPRLPRLFYWAAPSGRRVLVWQTDSPHGVAYLEGNLLGLADSPALADELLPEYLAALAARPYPYGRECAALGIPADVELDRQPYPHDVLHLRVQGLLADNAPPSLVPSEVVRSWNERWAYPRLRLATNAEFFGEAEARVGRRLETFTGDWTNWWADGMGSGARANGFNRRAQATVRTGQMLNVAADVVGDDGGAWAEGAERAYEAMGLFDEHTWGAAHPGDDASDGRRSGALQWQTKASLAGTALDQASSLAERGASRLAMRIPAAEGAVAALLVVNPASFDRTDVVRVFVPAHRLRAGVAVRDESTGAEVPFAFEAGLPGRNRPQGKTLSFLASDVPSLGFRRYTLVPSSLEQAGESGAETTLENEHYLVELDPAEGTVVRLVDRELGVDLVDPASPLGFGRYVYDRYAGSLSATMRLRDGGAGPAPAPALPHDVFLERRSLGGSGAIRDRMTTPVEERVTLRLAADGAAALELTLRLVRGVRRLDLEYRLDKTPVTAKEGVYLAFPFAVDDADVLFEVTGAVAASRERLPGSAPHVQVVRHWAALAGRDVSVALGTLEASLVEHGNIFLPYPPYRPTLEGTHGGMLVAWLMNNVWDTNFVLSQAGESRFSFAVASGAGDARALGIRTGAAVALPLVGIVAASRTIAPFAPPAGSFCTLDHPAVEVVTLAASRRGHDFVAFVQSHAEEEVNVRVDFPALDVERVWLGTFLERDERDITDDGGARIMLRPGDVVSLGVDLRRA